MLDVERSMFDVQFVDYTFFVKYYARVWNPGPDDQDFNVRLIPGKAGNQGALIAFSIRPLPLVRQLLNRSRHRHGC